MEVYRDFQEGDEVMILSLGYIGKYLLFKAKSTYYYEMNMIDFLQIIQVHILNNL